MPADKPSALRRIARFLPLTGSLLGMTSVFGGVILFYYGYTHTWIPVVTGGVLFLVSGIWFSANPFVRNERRYTMLREEVDTFIMLVRQLNTAAALSDGDALTQLRAAMHASVDRMNDVAGRIRARSGLPSPEEAALGGQTSPQRA